MAMEPITDIPGCFSGLLATSISSYINDAAREMQDMVVPERGLKKKKV